MRITKNAREFDYVIVGAGSAGCVLANRLSERADTTVAVIEAGGPDKKQEIHVPAAFSKLFKSAYDWAYYTEEQEQLNNRKLYWPRGKVLGGSSSMNAMIYTRGNPRDFDHWQHLGNEGWSFNDVLPAFTRRMVEVSPLRTVNPLSYVFVDACGEMGIARNDDFNGTTEEGAGLFHVTQRGGKRHSCAVAYLKPALQRPNLTAITGAHTTRVLFERKRASGIEFVRNGAKEQLHANREVILCGGAVNSPQILMLSGVGAADELRKLDIATVADVPGVGRNLQDHLVAGVVHHCTKPVTLGGAETIGNLLRFLLFKNGMLTSNVAEAGAFVRSSARPAVPDIELIFGPAYYMSHGFESPKGHGFTVGAILLHPKSMGEIRLRSNDPFAAPAIQPRYLSDASDRSTLVEGTKLCRHIARASAFDAYRGGEVWPGSPAQTDAEMESFIRRTAETLYHPVGTCKMGNDALAVVDSRLRVRGVEGLRVIDASVMPAIVTGHPNAAVIMIAEKGAELIQTR